MAYCIQFDYPMLVHTIHKLNTIGWTCDPIRRKPLDLDGKSVPVGQLILYQGPRFGQIDLKCIVFECNCKTVFERETTNLPNRYTENYR